MTMGRDDGLIDTIDMLHQILDLLEIFLRQTVACGVRDVHYSGTSLDHSLHHLSQVFIIRTAGILTVKLHIVDITLGILRGSYSLFEDMLAVGVKLIQNMLVAGANTRMDTLVLGVFQSLEGHVDIMLHRTGQCTDHGPSHCL